MKSIVWSIASIGILLLSSIQPANAEYENRSFRVFGAAGLQYVNYSEKLDNFAGMEVESRYDAVNFVQKAGGYNAISGEYGFYIRTASTLISDEQEEEWHSDQHAGPIQTDTAAMNFSTIDIVGVKHLRTGVYLTSGLHYQKIAFSRFDWHSTAHTAAFADDIEEFIRNDPAQISDIQNQIDNGNLVDSAGDPITTLDEYFEATRFIPEETQDVVFEDASSFSALVGVGYDSYFMDRTEGIRFIGSIALGTQVYEHVLNSSNRASIDRWFGGGMDVQAEAGLGYQFSPKLGLMILVSGNYSYRPELSEKLNSTQTLSVPENRFYAVANYLSFSWNFR